MEKQRTDAYDRWNWETGSEEDREEFERLDKELKELDENNELAEMLHIAKGVVYKRMREDIIVKQTDSTTRRVMSDIIDKLEEKEEENWKSRQ